MKLKLSPWSIVIGLLVILMALSILGVVPYVTPMNVFWLVVTVATVWLIIRVFFSEKKS